MQIFHIIKSDKLSLHLAAHRMREDLRFPLVHQLLMHPAVWFVAIT